MTRSVKRYFQTQGPCDPTRHYMIPPFSRLHSNCVAIDAGGILWLRAPKKAGKTTQLHAFVQEWNDGCYDAILIDVTFLHAITSREACVRELIRHIFEVAKASFPKVEISFDSSFFDIYPHQALLQFLRTLCASFSKPVVICFDHMDVLVSDVWWEIVSQLLTGFQESQHTFVHAVVLVGNRYFMDFLDKKRHIDDSVGNISLKESVSFIPNNLLLPNFTSEQVLLLSSQYYDDTNTLINQSAIERIFYWTEGQPWFINAILFNLIQLYSKNNEYSQDDVDNVVVNILKQRFVPFHSLEEVLKDPNVRKIIDPLLVGGALSASITAEALSYVQDLGLIELEPEIRFAHPIYKEMIPRTLSYPLQTSISMDKELYLRPNGVLDMTKILTAFQRFFAEHSEHWLSQMEYTESSSHLILMAFLQRLIEDSGIISRDFSITSGSMSVCIEWKQRKYLLEVKLRKHVKTDSEGIEQLSSSMKQYKLHEGYLVLFDKRTSIGWQRKLYRKQIETSDGEWIYLFGV